MPSPLLALAVAGSAAAAATVCLAILPGAVCAGTRSLDSQGSAGLRTGRGPSGLLRGDLLRPCLAALGAGAALGLLALVILGLPLPAVVVGCLGAVVERALGRWREGRRRAAQRDALVSAVDLLGQLLPAGHGVRQSLQVLAESGPLDLRPELGRVVTRLRETSLEQALMEADHRLQQPLFTLIATTLTVGGRSGGRISPLLEELSRAAHQIQAAQEQLRAEQAQGRLGALVIAVMPLALISVLRVVNPNYLSPYGTFSGQLILTGLLALIVIGYLWMLRILRITDLESLVPADHSPAGSAHRSPLADSRLPVGTMGTGG